MEAPEELLVQAQQRLRPGPWLRLLLGTVNIWRDHPEHWRLRVVATIGYIALLGAINEITPYHGYSWLTIGPDLLFCIPMYGI